MPRPMGHIRILFSSRVLLDLEEADQVFKEKGVDGYRDYMLCTGAYEADRDPELGCRRFDKGPLFDMALALNRLNQKAGKPLVELGMSAKDTIDTGLVLEKNLNASALAAALTYSTSTSGGPVSEKAHRAFKTDLFLTRSDSDAQAAIDLGIAAAVMNFPPQGPYDFDHDLHPIHIVVDGDAVAFGDSAEVRYREALDTGKTPEEGLQIYVDGEKRDMGSPVEQGPFTALLTKLTQLNAQFPKGEAPFSLSLLTARGTEARARAIATALDHGIDFNGDCAYVSGAAKSDWLAAYRPHVFFDDQQAHLGPGAHFCPTGRVPYKTNGPMYEYLKRKELAANTNVHPKVAEAQVNAQDIAATPAAVVEQKPIKPSANPSAKPS